MVYIRNKKLSPFPEKHVPAVVDTLVPKTWKRFHQSDNGIQSIPASMLQKVNDMPIPPFKQNTTRFPQVTKPLIPEGNTTLSSKKMFRVPFIHSSQESRIGNGDFVIHGPHETRGQSPIARMGFATVLHAPGRTSLVCPKTVVQNIQHKKPLQVVFTTSRWMTRMAPCRHGIDSGAPQFHCRRDNFRMKKNMAEIGHHAMHRRKNGKERCIGTQGLPSMAEPSPMFCCSFSNCSRTFKRKIVRGR